MLNSKISLSDNEREIHQNNNHRMDYIDVCKCFGIILVVLGHSYGGVPDVLYNLIYSFHMPLFFLISGYVFNDYNLSIGIKSFIVKKLKGLIVPYIVFSFVNLLIQVFLNTIKGIPINIDYFVTKIIGVLFCYNDLENMPNCSPIWFLLVLFISTILFYCVLQIKNSYIKTRVFQYIYIYI